MFDRSAKSYLTLDIHPHKYMPNTPQIIQQNNFKQRNCVGNCHIRQTLLEEPFIILLHFDESLKQFWEK